MSALAHDIDHIRNVFLAQLVRARLDHDAQHRLGAALAQEDAALIAEALSHRLHRRNDGGGAKRGVLIVDLHIRELLRIFAHGRSQFGERLLRSSMTCMSLMAVSKPSPVLAYLPK